MEPGCAPVSGPRILAVDPAVHLPKRGVPAGHPAAVHSAPLREAAREIVAPTQAGSKQPPNFSSVALRFLSRGSRSPFPPRDFRRHRDRRRPHHFFRFPAVQHPPDRPARLRQRRARRPDVIQHDHHTAWTDARPRPAPSQHPSLDVRRASARRHARLRRPVPAAQEPPDRHTARHARPPREHRRVIHAPPHPVPPARRHRHQHARPRLDPAPIQLDPDRGAEQAPQIIARPSEPLELQLENGVPQRADVRPHTHEPIPREPLAPAPRAPVAVRLVCPDTRAAPPARDPRRRPSAERGAPAERPRLDAEPHPFEPLPSALVGASDSLNRRRWWGGDRTRVTRRPRECPVRTQRPTPRPAPRRDARARASPARPCVPAG